MTQTLKQAARLSAKERGAALLIAMLTVALVASLAAATLWQQWRSVQVEAAERARAQSLWVLTGALDWARLILREDARTGGADHLGEPWAMPLEEARLSTFLAADKTTSLTEDNTMDQTFLSGRITDLQSRMNVLNLVENGKVVEGWMRAFTKLYEHLGLAPAELATVAENLRFAQDAALIGNSARLAPLLPQRIGQLRWAGLSASSLAALAPYITVLPVRTHINLNTADAVVLYACIPSLDMARAQGLVTKRQTAHFRTLADATQELGTLGAELNENQHGVNARFFEVQGRLRLGSTLIEERSVVQREGIVVTTLWRERGSQALPKVR